MPKEWKHHEFGTLATVWRCAAWRLPNKRTPGDQGNRWENRRAPRGHERCRCVFPADPSPFRGKQRSGSAAPPPTIPSGRKNSSDLPLRMTLSRDARVAPPAAAGCPPRARPVGSPGGHVRSPSQPERPLTQEEHPMFPTHPPRRHPPRQGASRQRRRARPLVEVLEDRLVPSNWFVSTLGSDNNPGTIAAPLASIQHAVNVAQSGDRIHVAQGVYGYVGADRIGDDVRFGSPG